VSRGVVLVVTVVVTTVVMVSNVVRHSSLMVVLDVDELVELVVGTVEGGF